DHRPRHRPDGPRFSRLGPCHQAWPPVALGLALLSLAFALDATPHRHRPRGGKLADIAGGRADHSRCGGSDRGQPEKDQSIDKDSGLNQVGRGLAPCRTAICFMTSDNTRVDDDSPDIRMSTLTAPSFLRLVYCSMRSCRQRRSPGTTFRRKKRMPYT